jgi:hypothetical protein
MLEKEVMEPLFLEDILWVVVEVVEANEDL